MIVDRTIPRITLRELCAKHTLTIEVNERAHVPQGSVERIYAKLKGVEIMRDGMLCSTFANGKTSEQAIAGLPDKYSDQRLVIHAYSARRFEFGPYVITGVS